MIIVLDTNIIQRDFLLRSSLSQAFLHYLKRTQSRVLLPQLVVDELVANYERELRSRVKTVSRDHGHLVAIYLGDLGVAPTLDIPKAVSTYKAHILSTLALKETDLYQFKPHYLSEAISRAINRILPCSDRGEEIRDCLLWFMLKDIARDHIPDPTIFISGDKGGFADSEGALHAALADELREQGLMVTFYPSLDRFAREHASKIEFITVAWINATIQPDDILRSVEEKLEQSLVLKLPSLPFHSMYYTGDTKITDGGVDLDDFYVNELADGSYRVEATYTGEVEFEVQVAAPKGRDQGLSTGASSSALAYEVLPTAFSSGSMYSSGTEYSYERVHPTVDLTAELVVRGAEVSSWQVIDFSVSSPWR